MVTFCFFVAFQPENTLPISFLSRGAPHPESTLFLFSKKDKTGYEKLHGFYSRNNNECIQCELLPLGNSFPSGSLKLERN